MFGEYVTEDLKIPIMVHSQRKKTPAFGHKVLWPESPVGFIYPHSRLTVSPTGHNPNTCQQGTDKSTCSRKLLLRAVTDELTSPCWCCLHRSQKRKVQNFRASLHMVDGMNDIIRACFSPLRKWPTTDSFKPSLAERPGLSDFFPVWGTLGCLSPQYTYVRRRAQHRDPVYEVILCGAF